LKDGSKDDNFLYPAFARAAAVFNTLDIVHIENPEVAADAARNIQEGMLDKVDIIQAAVNAQSPSLLGGASVEYSKDVLRTYVYMLWESAISVFELFKDGMIFHVVPANQVADLADTLCRFFNSFVKMDLQLGAFNGIKKEAGSNLSLTWQVTAVIAIAVVAVFMILAWWVITYQELSKVNQRKSDICKKAIEEKNPTLMNWCLQKADKANPIVQLPQTVVRAGASAMTPALTVMGIGLVAYAGIMLYPHLKGALTR
jgi:hypothetical protein